MQLSIATLTAIVVTLANAAPISPADQIAAIVDGKPLPQHPAHHEVNKDNSKDVVDLLGHAQLVNGDGLNVLGGKANGGISKRQELERLYPEHYGSVESSKDNSEDILDVLGHAKLLNGNAINLLGGKANGGISKRQLGALDGLLGGGSRKRQVSSDNSKDVVDALGHVQALNNDGINVLGHSANGGIGKRQVSSDNSKDVVDALGHVQALNNDGINILGGKANGGIGRRQVNSDNSADVVDALGHVQALNNDGINVLGHSANGGIGKRGNKDNSQDVVDLLGHLQLLNDSGLNVLGGSANGGIGKRSDIDNSEDVADVLGHAKLLDNDGINVLGGSANGGAAHKPEPKPVVIKEKEQHHPEHHPEPDHVSIVGPSFEANQIQQVRQQNHQ
ncbi:uncharacterized protein ASPGLDRAFT_50238 [Aspergillus glaucus CBS 516.65]|uniref:Uncharacterized protein n=1 Tax=Aspergillus glaucus CBS 516.65 TaxID=1160497 RepID=A0A1L9VCL8_ASPGL|nr:hypothetical protein ASPGLDRAFT_50238 [Aspergillus glaucus CBS 516.65]OJJ81691.1 hypothetical protein ASPGLDRAFT_50238 [Aspergillus glaucus CBS 516.65]